MTTITSPTRRLVSLGAAAGIAAFGAVAVSAPAHAAPADKVWVCKYVGKPGAYELLKEGKNPIEVSANSIKTDGQVYVGDQFADAQGLSVVVQIAGSDPGVDICAPTPPVVPVIPLVPLVPATPGTNAPATGGEGDTAPPLGLLAGGAILASAGLIAADATRRRRAALRS